MNIPAQVAGAATLQVAADAAGVGKPSRLQGVVLAASGEAALVRVAGGELLLRGAPPLAPGTPVTIVTPGGTRPGAAPIQARLLAGGGPGTAGVPVTLAAPSEAPAVLAPRPAPALAARISTPEAPGRSVEVAVRLAVLPPSPDVGGSPRLEPASVAAALAALADGQPLAAQALPRAPGGRVRLAAAGGLEVRIEGAGPDLPEGAAIGLRLAEAGPAASRTAAALLGALLPQREGGGEVLDAAPLERWRPDVRLGGRLRDAADALASGEDPAAAAGPPEAALAFLLGEPGRAAPLRVALARDGSGARRDGDEDEPPAASVEVTFGHLGRIRLEIGRDRAGGTRLVVRSERALPRGAADDLRALAGAAFELGGQPAYFLALVGPLPPAPARVSVAG